MIRKRLSDCARTYARSRERNRVLIGTSTAPIFWTAKAMKIHSSLLLSHRATCSPGLTPAAIRRRAASSIRAATSGVGQSPHLNAAWFFLWIVWNLIPSIPHFDPYPFGFLTMVVSLEAIFRPSAPLS